MNLAIFVTFLGGCMPLGLPEHFAPLEFTPRTAARLVVISSERPLEETALRSAFSHSTVGRQYVLGFIPLTRLFFSHGAEAFVLEALLSADVDDELTVLSRNSAPKTVSELRPDYIVEAKVDDLDATAYDALFFRVTTFTGTLRLRYYNQRLETVAEESVPMSATHYRRFAHGVEMMYFLKKELARACQVALRRRPARIRWETPASRDANLIGLLPPRLSQSLANDVGRELAAGYGYPTAPPLTTAEVARVIQRGLMLASTDHPTAAFLSPPRTERRWALQSELSQFAMTKTGIHIAVDFQLLERGQLLYHERCKGDFAAVRAADGALGVTLEQASKSLFESFLNRTSDSPCEPL